MTRLRCSPALEGRISRAMISSIKVRDASDRRIKNPHAPRRKSRAIKPVTFPSFVPPSDGWPLNPADRVGQSSVPLGEVPRANPTNGRQAETGFPWWLEGCTGVTERYVWAAHPSGGFGGRSGKSGEGRLGPAGPLTRFPVSAQDRGHFGVSGVEAAAGHGRPAGPRGHPAGRRPGRARRRS